MPADDVKMQSPCAPCDAGVPKSPVPHAQAASAAVQQTLAEQMRLTHHEIEDRKRLLGLTLEDEAALSSLRAHIAAQVDDLVARFYEFQVAIPEIALVIGDVETLQRLQRAMRSYILEMFDGQYDVDYVNKRLRIGKVHQRIGVSPKLYTAALQMLHRLLDDTIDEACRDDLPLAKLRKQALSKIFNLDIQLVFDTYIASLVTVVESAKEKVERYAVGLEEQVAQRTRQLEQLSRIDPLTGLGNKVAFYEHLHREFSAVTRYGKPLTLLFIDLNGFKAVNDEDGHLIGDRILSETAEVIRQSIRDADIACRFGGDEFCILLPNSAAAAARLVCERIAAAFDRLIGSKVSLSIGVAETEPGGYAAEEDFIQAADAAMYVAKTRARVTRQHVFEVAEGDVSSPRRKDPSRAGNASPGSWPKAGSTEQAPPSELSREIAQIFSVPLSATPKRFGKR